jgi:predicted RNA methylase
MKHVDPAALAVISSGIVEGNSFSITSGQLDRKLYTAVNEALENIGGKWNRAQKTHIFPQDPTNAIEDLLLTGTTVNEKQLYQFFETPREVADRVIELADIQPGMSVLEPEAGRGALLDALPDIDKVNVTCVELDPKHVPILKGKHSDVIQQDFMTFQPAALFDRIIMNPPFTKQQDIDHVLHAYELLANGGRLVAIMSPGFTFRVNKKSVEFKELVELAGFYEELPEGAFKESGTGVRTVIVVLSR